MNKTILYLIRHGESQGNAVRSFLGHTDLDLTELGHIQAEKTAEFLKAVHVDAIYASDLIRAYNTAKHTADVKGMEIVKNSNLREIYAGAWENVSFDALMELYPSEYTMWRTNVGMARPTDGESVTELQDRIVSEIEKIAKENSGKTVFIFTHATPIRTFKAFCDKCTAEDMKEIPWASNASVTSAEYENGRFTMLKYSDDSFMGDISTVLPVNV